ncbi:MAG: glycosyltransferase family 9 protein [Pyrinomonadaceae bacterium]
MMPHGDIDWQSVKRVLVVKLRSIGDTVLSTPSLIALDRFLPEAQIDILLEDWVAPILHGFEHVDSVISVGKSAASRASVAWNIRRRGYDVVFNLHGGSTSTFFTRASGAPHRIGNENYRYSFLYNRLLNSSADFWQKAATHSAEQQLALLGSVGISVMDRPRTKLVVTPEAAEQIDQKLGSLVPDTAAFALLHPASALATKQWSADNFARIAEFLAGLGLSTIAIASPREREVLEAVKRQARVPIAILDDLSLPEITALAARARIFVGNDSGIAHIAAAVNTPTVVIFGSSNRIHWHPWTDARNEMVYLEMPCQPCPGYSCAVFGEPKCILGVTAADVTRAVERVLT